MKTFTKEMIFMVSNLDLVEPLVNIQNLIDDAKCYETVRKLRWSNEIILCPLCPLCNSSNVIKHGHHNTESERQKYLCKDGNHYFDDLTGTVFEGHHQPLRVWILCLYFMGLNLSNRQIA
jgi:transposase-like protein